MVSPVSGPFVVQKIIKGDPNAYGGRPNWVITRREWSRQKPPYSLELPFRLNETRVKTAFGGDGTDIVEYSNCLLWLPPSDYSQRLYNDAYSKTMEKARGVQSTLGATLGEWRSSSSMIIDRANQLVRGIRAAKRGDLSGLKRAWGKHAGIRPRARAAGGQVLEYSFGWAPLVSDINSALDVLHNRMPPHRVRVRRSVSVEGVKSYNYGSVTRTAKGKTDFSWELRCRVDLTNPNTALAEQLGLVNLASVIWELTPNSYILDYFVNVSDFLGSFTDRIGLNLSGEAKTLKIVTDNIVTGKWNIAYPGYSPYGWVSQQVAVTRSLGLPGPTIALRLPWRFSVQRASTSIARLLQQLKGK